MKKKVADIPQRQPGSTFLWFPSFRVQLIVLALVSFGLYINTASNEYALDDGIVMEKNEYVHEGIAGIGDLMTKDAYESFYRQMNAKDQLKGGRYRPLSLVTFAIEYELMGFRKGDAVSLVNAEGQEIDGKILKFEPGGELQVRYKDGGGQQVTATFPMRLAAGFKRLATFQHIMNVLLYAGCVVLLFWFLRNFLLRNVRYGAETAFLASLIFLLHPVHTEVIANIKSRDELLSFGLVILALVYAYKLLDECTPRRMALLAVSFFMALLAKEYAVILLVLVPLIYYVQRTTWKQLWFAMGPMAAVFLAYALLRLNASVLTVDAGVMPDVLNDPYLFATPSQKLATKIYILLEYLRLLIFPYPLSSDYSYSHFAYRDFSDAAVWLSVIIHAALVAGTVWALRRRHWLFFAGAFYLGNLALVSNLLLDIGATMGERLIFHSSLGFCLLAAYGIVFLVAKTGAEVFRKTVFAGVLAVLAAVSGWVVLPRNADWKNDSTLFLRDVTTNPGSAMLNGNAGAQLILLSEKPENKRREPELLEQSIVYSEKAISIHKEYVNAYLNLGLAHYKLGRPEMAGKYWSRAKELFPSNPLVQRFITLLGNYYLNEGLQKGLQSKDYALAISLMEKAAVTDPGNAEIFYNLGGAHYTIGELEKARAYWNKTLAINPAHVDARRGLDALAAAK